MMNFGMNDVQVHDRSLELLNCSTSCYHGDTVAPNVWKKNLYIYIKSLCSTELIIINNHVHRECYYYCTITLFHLRVVYFCYLLYCFVNKKLKVKSVLR